jgi:hypothetical protein
MSLNNFSLFGLLDINFVDLQNGVNFCNRKLYYKRVTPKSTQYETVFEGYHIRTYCCMFIYSYNIAL